MRDAETESRAIAHSGALVRDPLFAGFGLLFLLAALPYFFPRPGSDLWQVYTTHGADLLLIGAVLGVILRGLSGIPRSAERRFWSLVLLALGSWWVVKLISIAAPELSASIRFSLLRDGLYVLFYLALLLATLSEPDRLGAPRPEPRRRIERAGLMVFAVSFLTYFVIVPGLVDPASYETRMPSFYFFLSLDLLLAVAFMRLAWTSRTRRWRVIFGLFALTTSLWLVLDTLELLIYSGFLDWPDGQPADVLWKLPLVSMVAAARSRDVPFPDDKHAVERETSWGTREALRLGGILFVAAAVVSLVHAGGYGFRLLAENLRPGRDLTVVATLAILVALAVADRRLARVESLRHVFFLDSLLERSPLATVLLDARHRIVACNPAFESLFVYAREEVVGRDLDDLITRSENSQEAGAITRRVLAGETVYMVTRRHRSDGGIVDVRIFGVPLVVDGRLAGVFALYQDITEQRDAERRLRESEERFRRLAEAAHEGVVIFLDGQIVDANEQFARIFGYSLEEVKGVIVGRRVVPEHQKKLAEHAAATDERPYEIEAFRRDRSRMILEVRDREITFQGRMARVAAVRDVTEARRIEAELRQAQKLEAIGRLAAGVAHDFNNLLTVILGRATLLVHRLEPGSPLRSHADEIISVGRRAAALVSQLLAFGRKQSWAPQVVDLGLVVAGFKTVIERLLPSEVELVLELEPDLDCIEADPAQIEQIVLNLALNARDAMPGGGRLTIATFCSHTGDGEASTLGLAPGPWIGLRVSDTGVGMDAETASRAFEPFYTTKETGTGLGLATVQGIVRQVGGRIAVASTQGAGTTFRVYLPATKKKATSVMVVGGRALRQA